MNASPTVLPRRASASYQALRLGLVVLRHLLQRPAYLAAVVVSFALVAGVCALTFSVRHGLLATVEASQEPGLFFLMNAQADSELSSIVTPAQALYLQQLPNLGGGCGPAAARAGRSPNSRC
ncbi:hypothetical protein [Burkholderia sp. 22PA0106]|uniref:hypothetical protein n=1 Tax=Burkholderia sp. 22PA0106 TaxID=3237371 RepID=UPI0039C2F11D